MTGATSASVTLGPMETTEITVVLGWFFPDRDFLGLPVGQLCTQIHIHTYMCARGRQSSLYRVYDCVGSLFGISFSWGLGTSL